MRNFLRSVSQGGSPGKRNSRALAILAIGSLFTFGPAKSAYAQCEWTALSATATCDGDDGSGGDILTANFDDHFDLIDNTLTLSNTDNSFIGFEAPVNAGTDAGTGDTLIVDGDNLSSIDNVDLTDVLGFEILRKQGASTWGIAGDDSSVIEIFVEGGQVNFGVSVVDPSTFTNATLLSISGGGEVDGYLMIDDSAALGTTISVAASSELEAQVSLGGGVDQITNYGQVSSPQIDFGDGDDLIFNYSAWDAVVLGGAGSDQVTNNGTISGTVINPEWDLGDGEDVFSNYGTVEAEVQIDLGADEDTLNINSGSIQGTVTLDAAGENDFLTVASGATLAGSALMGDGANQISINGLLGPSGSVTAGAGVDTLIIGSTGDIQGDIDLGAGNNIVQLDGTLSSTGSLAVGGGNDSLTLGSTGRLYAATSLAGGTDTLNVLSGALIFADIATGADADDVTLAGSLQSGASILTESGNDTFTLSATGEIASGGSVGLGEDADQATVFGDIHGILNLDEGADTAVWDSDSSSVTGRFLGGEQSAAAVDANLEIDEVRLFGSGGELVDLNLTGGRFEQWEHLTVNEGDWVLNNGGVDEDDLVTLQIEGGSFTIPVGDQLTPDTVELLNGDLHVDGVLDAANGVDMSDGVLTGTGEIVGDVSVADGTISPETVGEEGELRIDGDLTLGEDVELIMDVDPVTGEADRLIVTGELTTTNTKLTVDGNAGGADDQDFVVIDAGTIDGDLTIDDTATLDFDLTIDPVTGDVSIKVNPNYDNAGGNDGDNTDNQNDTRQGIADAVDEGTIDEDLLDALDDVEDQDYLAILDQLHGEPYILNSVAVIMANNLFSHQILHRLGDRERCGSLDGALEGRCRSAGERDVWVDFVHERLDYEHPDASMKANIDLNQVYVGVDAHAENATFGFAGAYARNNSKTDLNAQIDGQILNLGVYGSQNLGLFNLDGALVYGVSRQQTQRKIVIEGTLGAQDVFEEIVVGESSRQTILLDSAVTQEYRIESGLELQPKVGLTFSHSLAGRVRETPKVGSNCGACLQVDLDPYTRLSTNIGAEARLAIDAGRNLKIFPEFRAAWEHTLVGREAGQTNAFANGSNVAWSIDGYMPDNQWSAGFGLNLEIGEAWIGYADFDRTTLTTGKDSRYSIGLRRTF